MTKEELGAIGLTEEQVTKVLETVNKDFVPKTTFDTVNTELQTAKGTIQERDKQLETLQKADGDVEALKQTITNLQTENKNQQKLHEDEMKAIKIGNAVDAALRDAKAINPATVKPLLDTFLKNATLADDGTIAGLETDQSRRDKLFVPSRNQFCSCHFWCIPCWRCNNHTRCQNGWL